MSIIGYLAVEREKNILYNEVEKQGRLLGETLAIPIINDLIYERLGLVEEGGFLTIISWRYSIERMSTCYT